MTLDFYQIDAFTNELFKGNSAAVCPLNDWISDELLLNIAKENNLAETAFFVHKQDNIFHLRWFTPEIEMDLCGHATLASAYVILKCLKFDFETVIFSTLSGDLRVKVIDDQFEMEFPSRPPKPSKLPEIIKHSLSIQPKEVLKARDYMLVYDTEEDVLNLAVSSSVLEQINLDPGGIIVTSKGNKSDFVSRFFTPGAAVFEDPVTGSAHCTLVPFWADRLHKNELYAIQVSERGGELYCKLKEDSVFITGEAVKFLQGTIELD
jgi:PhzF family phenazine biosynthesis protein